MEPGTLRLLLIEDNPGDARLVREALADSKWRGLDLEHVASLGEGLARLAQGGVDAVLLDLTLPDSDGLDTLVRVLERAPRMPVVVLTGLEDEALAFQLGRHGAADYLVKGRVDPDSLARSLRYAIERLQAEEARRLAEERLREIGRLRAVNQFKTQLLNTVGHELNTPLTPIRLQVDLLKRLAEGKLGEAEQRSLVILERNFDRLSKLVHDVLDVARLEAGRLELRLEPLDLGALVAEAAEAFEEPVRRAGVGLACSASQGLLVRGDAARLGQVLDNLLSNAAKFTPRGGRIAVEVAPRDREVTVSVRDTGIGLRAEDLPKLFEPFSQVHDPMQHTQPGTGLGLFICKGIVEQHGGRIWAESEGPGKGATFTFALPREGP